MENNIQNQIMFHFSGDGLIFFCKSNQYYKNVSLKYEEIMTIYNTLNSNSQFQNLENKICYQACCLYLLTKYDEKHKNEFCQKIISTLSIKQNPINDTYLFLIFNCIDFDENFIHSDKKRLNFLLKYLERFSSLKKTKENYLLYKYYRGILYFRIGNIEEALNESFGIIGKLSEEQDKMTKFMEFIKLKNELFQIRINEAYNDQNHLKENYILLKEVYEKVKNENPFLALKLGFDLYNNLYIQGLYNDCISILQQMHQIIKNYERKGIPPKKLLRFSLSIFCRYGFLGILLSNKQLVDISINEISNGLRLLKDDKNNKKIMSIFKAYHFALMLIKLNCGIYIDQVRELANIFMKEFILDKFNNEGRYLGDNYCINNQNVNQCIINLNSINNNLDLSMNDKAQKIVDYYITNLSSPTKNLISHDAIFSFVIGIHDRIRAISEKYLDDNNQYNQEKYKYQMLTNSNYFWNFVNGNVDSEPLLKTDFFKSIIIKIFSCCAHIYYYNNDFQKILNSINSFENLSKKLNINENTPSYELVYKVKGDYYFKNNDYKSSIDCYNKSVNKMNDKNPKKPLVFFNLGVLYYYSGDKNSAIENMKKSCDYFRKVDDEKSSFEFHKRNKILTKKYNLAQYIIKEIQNN